MENLGYLYSIAIAAGGVMGYVKKGSAMSLAAGVLFGGLSAAGTYQMSNDPNNCYLLLASSGMLAIIMGVRGYRARKFMPSGMIAVLSAAVVIGLIPRLIK